MSDKSLQCRRAFSHSSHSGHRRNYEFESDPVQNVENKESPEGLGVSRELAGCDRQV